MSVVVLESRDCYVVGADLLDKIIELLFNEQKERSNFSPHRSAVDMKCNKSWVNLRFSWHFLACGHHQHINSSLKRTAQNKSIHSPLTLRACQWKNNSKATAKKERKVMYFASGQYKRSIKNLLRSIFGSSNAIT